MANTLNQTVFQVSEGIPERMIVQFTNDEGEQVQTINNYASSFSAITSHFVSAVL